MDRDLVNEYYLKWTCVQLAELVRKRNWLLWIFRVIP